MNPETELALPVVQAPPVVAVVVVHEAGEWFDATLDSFTRQDYPNLRYLFLVTGESTGDVDGGVEGEVTDSIGDQSTADRVHAWIPDAFVRQVDGNPGFGSVANEVLRLVDGDNGLFLICHDDIALDPDAVRLMVEELYRSNAGAVGPKLVDWDDPRVLQSVGIAVDRFGEVDVGLEPGEVDQEQHDGVRDVFALASACILVRADLFRALDGFDRAIDFHGDDIELCWRIHHSGARVVVAPAARVRHRARLAQRRPELAHQRMRARHRMRTVATLTAASRLPGRSVEMVLLTAAELIVGVFTATFREALSSLRALLGLLPRTASLLARRKVVKPIRRVPEREVAGLQANGSSRLNSYMRTRDTAIYVAEDVTVRRWRDGTAAPFIAWAVVLLAVVVGSRSFIANGVPAVGEFLPFTDSPQRLLDSFASGWNDTGGGATSPNPTGWATLAGLSIATLFRMGALQTLLTVGLLVVGLIGMWKLATVFPSTRARVVGLVVYAASPLVGGAMAGGRLTVLVVYAIAPWIVHLLRRAAGIDTADPDAAQFDLTDGVVPFDNVERTRRIVVLGLVVALAAAFAPIVVVVVIALGLLLAIGTLLARASWRVAAWFALGGAVAGVIATILNLPWSTTWSWSSLVGAPPLGAAGRGLFEIASFEIGPTDFAALAAVLFLPVVAAVALSRAWRLTWAVRSGVIVLGFGALAVLGDRGSLPVDVPEAGVLLVPVALAVSISSAVVFASFDADVRGDKFGWRQPLGILAMVAVVVGVVPGVLAIGDGAWKTPTTTLGRLINAGVPDDVSDGDFRVLMIGDSRLLPAPATEYRDGVSWVLFDDGDLDIRDRWAAPETEANAAINEALDQIAASTTLRAGRLLAPLGIRYIVVPEFDGVESTTDSPLPLPAGLEASLDEQLDLASVAGAFPTLDIYENSAWLPTVSALGGAAADASRGAGIEALLRADLSESSPVLVGADQFSTTTDELAPSSVQLGVPFDENWVLTVDGERVDARRSFGYTTAFDVANPGVGALRYDTSPTRSLLIAMQVVGWAAAIFFVLKIRVPSGRTRQKFSIDETLIVLDDTSVIHDPGLISHGPPVVESTGDRITT